MPHVKYTPDYHTAVQLQRLIVEACKDKTTPPLVLAQLARAWDALANRKRILLNRGLPKSIEATNKSKKSQPVPLTPVEE